MPVGTATFIRQFQLDSEMAVQHFCTQDAPFFLNLLGPAQYDKVRHTLVEIQTVKRFLDCQHSEASYYSWMDFLEFRPIMKTLCMTQFPTSSQLVDPNSLGNISVSTHEARLRAMAEDVPVYKPPDTPKQDRPPTPVSRTIDTHQHVYRPHTPVSRSFRPPTPVQRPPDTPKSVSRPPTPVYRSTPIRKPLTPLGRTSTAGTRSPPPLIQHAYQQKKSDPKQLLSLQPPPYTKRSSLDHLLQDPNRDISNRELVVS